MRLTSWSHRQVILLAIALAAIAVMLPVAISLELARKQARDEQARLAMRYARDVLRRSEVTADQMTVAFRRMARGPSLDRCTPDDISKMQAIALTSSNLQLVGLVKGDKLICSSSGAHAPPLPLGPIDYVSLTGLRIRHNVRLPFAPHHEFVVIESGMFAVLAHKALPVDTAVDDDGVSLAMVTASSPRTFTQRGPIRNQWIPRAHELAPGAGRIQMIDSHVVAQLRSSRYDFTAVAALDRANYQLALSDFAKVMVPIGLLCGVLLALAILQVVRAQTTIGAAIRSALRHDEFFLQLQPIVRLDNREWVGAEALLRWMRSDGQLVRPDIFVSAAEDAGLIVLLSQRLLRLVEPVLSELGKRQDGVFVSINLSAEDLIHETTLPSLREMVNRVRIEPGQLHLEITERVFSDTVSAKKQVLRMREFGFHISIDDFGTGYSSLSQLLTFELDTLKIDKAFVDTVDRNAVTSQVASRIVDIANDLSLDIVAEGIETERQVEILLGWNVHFGQGYLFSKPLDVEQFFQRVDELRHAASWTQ